MSLLLRKYFWVLNLLTIAVCATFAASALGKLVETKIPRAKVQRIQAPPPDLNQSISGPQDRDITSILTRNIFCSTCEEVTEKPDQPGENGATNDEPRNNEPVRTSLNLRLLATLVSDDKAWSFAVIKDTSAGDADVKAPKNQPTQGIIAIGDTVPGNSRAVVTDVMERRVLLLNGGRNEYLDLLEQAERPQPTALQPSGANEVRSYTGYTMPKAAAGLAEVAKGIQKVGEGKYEIQRSALNKVLGNTTMLARSARIVPSMRNGKPNGFKLYAIRPGSLYSLLGMFNGDTINAINGHSITTPDKALEVYTKLRSAGHISIAFSRRGKPLTHEYTIR